MKKKQMKKKILAVSKHYDRLSEQTDLLRDVLGSTVDSPLLNALWKLFDDHVKDASISMSDPQEMLSWYIFDNNCGCNVLGVKIANTKRVIGCVDDLIWSIKGLQKQERKT